MSGVRITFEFQHRAFTEALAKLDISSPGRRRGILGAIATGLLYTTRDRFVSSTDPKGNRWAPLNPDYAATRKPGRILMQQGDPSGLLGSLSSEVHGNTVVVGSNKIYAPVHQFGATIRPKNGRALVFKIGSRVIHARSVTIPARPYLGFGAADEEKVLDVLDVLLPGGR